MLGVYEEKFKPKETDLQNDLLLNSYNVTSVALKRAINNIFMTSDGSTASVSANGNLKLQAGNSITLKNFTAAQGSTFVAQITPVQANNNESVLTLKEHHIFGSSRLGLETKSLVVYNSTNTSGTVDPVQTNFLSLIGDKHFELSNHLGNVLALISDKKIPTAIAGVFNPDVLTYSDYYPFGMLVPNRHADSDKYRYGFQGQEMDNELKGEGNSLNYTFRMHDPRVGRFFAVDPLTHKFPFYSPYQFSSNSPIMSVELEGLETSKLVNENEKQKAINEHGAIKVWLTLRILDFYEGSVNVGRLTQGKPILKYPLIQSSPQENLESLKSVYNTTFEVMSVWETAKYGIGGEDGEISFSNPFKSLKKPRALQSVAEIRENLARNFLSKNGATDLLRHLKAIDYKSQVYTKVLEPGTKLYRWSRKSFTGSKEYFSTEKGFHPTEAGLQSSLFSGAADWQFEEFTLTKKIKALHSTVNLDGQPGVKQVYSTEIQANSTSKVINPEF
ncbi:RHS repeat domain-containing protein [Flavobacterium hydrophilum]|uniref:RHS repeat-associated core domain-containing protein n=1 Tax=Flavobacterium hydrophilum TaxID=2211445 RepID=A0A2V4C562_9FLAO|nr:RHS repeat-associated core domain-containing protein [Flavobacterium hydrophilum]PXY46479.1 hypothetical protein DMB68_04710 [Flavobacterium hydrophilum]